MNVIAANVTGGGALAWAVIGGGSNRGRFFVRPRWRRERVTCSARLRSLGGRYRLRCGRHCCLSCSFLDAHVWAGSAVAVYKVERFGAFRGRVEGGRVIVKRPSDEMSGEQWCRAALVQVDEAGLAHLFKATDRDGVSRRGGAYRVGKVVDDSENWIGDRFFGGGLHASPSPRQALARSGFEDKSGARFFEVTCPVSELVSVADDVCKAPRLRVVREVDSWGEPL